MDSEESEEAACSWAALQSTLLPPRGALPTSSVDGGDSAGVAQPGPPARFGLYLNGAAWGGWVRQSSPACAAASVAGAWNALATGGRRGAGALTQDDVVVGRGWGQANGGHVGKCCCFCYFLDCFCF